MDLAVIVLVLTCFANLSLGTFVLLRNPHARLGQSFFAMSFFISSWAVSNYLADYATLISLNSLFNKLAYLFALLALMSAVIFSHLFAGLWPKNPAKILITYASIAIIAGVFSLTSLVAGSVYEVDNGIAFTSGKLLPLYVFGLLVLLVFIVRDMFFLVRKGTAFQKRQARIIILSFAGSIVIALLTNAVIPSISLNWQTAKLGPPLLSLLVVASVTYAIIYQKLFDIRSFVVRAVAYSLTFGITSLLFIAPTVVLINHILNIPLDKGAIFLLVVINLVIAIVFQPLRKTFNKLTRELFFRDYYEPQEVLDKLSNLLVGSVDVAQIKLESIKMIEDALKPETTGYLLVYDQTLQNLQGRELLSLLIQDRSEIVVADELHINSELRHTLTRKNIAVAVSLKTKTAQLGYLILGYKQSGTVYSSVDKKFLSIAADEIAISLQNALHFEEIRRFNITLQQRIEEATKELQTANTRLKELDKSKDEFISMASHQLRTPLTAIKGYLSLVLEGDIGPVTENEKKMIKRAFDSAQKMVYLIADLLNVSRLQSGKLIIESKPTNLAEVVEGEVAQLQETAQNRKIRLDYQKPASFPMLIIDENKTRQVIMNFLDNAIYYTPAGGTVTAAVQVNGQNVDFTVTDTGMGVPKEVQAHLFAKFYRADNARKMRPDGTGLGLFMAKKVIDAQGGTILFQSEEGKGSTFGFRFPLKPLQNPAPNPSA